MQNGSIIRTKRLSGLDVWELMWREPGPDGKRKHRRMAIGPVDEFVDAGAARQRITALGLEINRSDLRMLIGISGRDQPQYVDFCGR